MFRSKPKISVLGGVDICCVCISSKDSTFGNISENFIKIGSKFIPLRELVLKEFNLINYLKLNDSVK